MHRYFIKTPWLVKQLFRNYVWNLPRTEPVVYLTFDDGPHPTITPWVLEQLQAYNAKATFFCVGENVVKYPEIYQRILSEGHAVGNHTHHHLNGWNTPADLYCANVREAAQYIQSALFRPPYGRIKKKQAEGVRSVLGVDAKIIMWDVLSCDFDTAFSKEQCLENVVRHAAAGTVIVFHDSEKAAPNMMYALPGVLQYLAKRSLPSKALHNGLK